MKLGMIAHTITIYDPTSIIHLVVGFKNNTLSIEKWPPESKALPKLHCIAYSHWKKGHLNSSMTSIW